MKNKQALTIFLGVFLLLVGLFFYSSFQTYFAYKSIARFNTDLAKKHAKNAYFFPKITNSLTFNTISSLKIWDLSLQQILLIDSLATDTSLFASQLLSKSTGEPLQLTSNILAFNQNTTKIISEINKSTLARIFINQDKIDSINQLKFLSNDFDLLVKHFLNQDTTYIIILQNTHEIRASGGFMGSYARLELKNGQISNLKIEDIYQPAGQFQGFFPAPKGVEQYLSSGKGLSLTDANWHPDFPTSAQQVLNYFAWGNEKNIDGLIAINLDLVENILKITGDIKLNDYDLIINSQNFADLARADRDEFFPGSRQKQNFLNSTLTQILIAIQDLEPKLQKKLISQLLSEIPRKNIQFFSTHSQIQNLYEKYNVSGTLNPNTDNFLYLVESNVGINKANAQVFRRVNIDIQDTITQISIDFNNKNKYDKSSKKTNPYLAEANHLHYVNYQRLIIPKSYQIEKIDLNGQIISSWDEEEVKNNNHEEFKQIGFLVNIPEQSEAKLNILLKSNQPFALNSQISILKQPGLPATPYSISYKQKKVDVLLEKDEFFEF